MEVNPIYAAMGTTIFEEMSALCRDGTRINLGQGFPDDNGPAALREAAARALVVRSNQYPPAAGLPELRSALSDFYRRTQYLALAPDQFVVTSGATEALASAILAVVSPGDEVVIFAPAYDLYAPFVRRAGGTPVVVNLRPPAWAYDRAEVEAAIGPGTRALILNDPLNPTGSVASEAELAMLAELCTAHDLVAICDEVWEAVRFDGKSHRSLLSFPGMEQRTIKIGSAGKLFGLTGWKLGWMAAATELARVVSRAHQFLTFTTIPATQWAAAEGLSRTDILDERLAGWSATRGHLNRRLEEAGFATLPGPATWFTCVDLAASGIALSDAEFARRAVNEGGVATIPVSAFLEAGRTSTIVRLCHCKAPEILDAGVARLAAFRDRLKACP